MRVNGDLLLSEAFGKDDVGGHVVSHHCPFPRGLGFQGPFVGGPEEPMDTGQVVQVRIVV